MGGKMRRCNGIVAVAVATALSCGCSQYLRYEGLSSDIRPLKTKEAEGGVAFAGGMSFALAVADAQRAMYFDAVSHHAQAKQALGAGLIGLSAWSVYRGVTSDAEKTKQLLALAGATGAAAYGIGTHLDSKDREQAYLAGYRSITCLMLKSRPLLIEQGNFDQWVRDVNALEDKIRDVDLELSVLQTIRYQELDQVPGKDPQPSVGKEFRHLYDALSKARKLLNTSHILKVRVEGSGFNLRRQVDEIVESVSAEVQRSEPNIPQLRGLVEGAANISKSFTGIKPIEPSDAGGAEVGATGDHDPAPAGTWGAPVPAGGAVPAAPAEAAQSGLGKRVDALVKSNAELKAKNQTLSKEVGTLGKENKALKKNTAGLAVKPMVTVEQRKNLRRMLSELYAQHRKVNLALVEFSALAKSVKDAGQCSVTSTARLHISPDVDELTVTPGQRYRFTISGGQGLPQAVLSGPNGNTDENRLLLVVTIEGGVAVATITVPSNPPEAMFLVVTDGAGKQREEIALTIQKPADPATPDAAKK